MRASITPESKTHRANEFATLAGVTVRTLHHYDRLGLLRPRRRTRTGYRLYEVQDLERLEQIVALKFVGLPLKQIKALLDQNILELSDALRLQRKALEEKRRLVDRAIQAIREAESAAQSGRRPDSRVFRKIIEVIEMETDNSWMMKYANDAAKAKIEARRGEWSPELQEHVSKQWSDLFHDVEAALGEDPASAKAQALLARWTALVESFTGGDPHVRDSVKKLYADQANWPSRFRDQMAPFSNPKVLDFIGGAAKAQKG